MCDSISKTELAGLLAPFTVGGEAGLMLYGVYLWTHFHYFKSSLYARLSTPVKAVLWSVLLLNTAVYAMVLAEIAVWQVSTNSVPESVYTGIMLDAVIPFFSGLVAIPVQILLAIRGSALIRRPWVRLSFLAFIGSTSLLALAAATVTSSLSIMNVNGIPPDRNGISLNYNNCITMWQWSTAVTDVAVSICLACTLSSRRQGFKPRTDGLLKRLISMAMSSAAYTAVLATLGAIISAVSHIEALSVTLIHPAFWYPLPACYGLSLFTTLSARHTINKHVGGDGEVKGTNSSGAASSAAASRGSHSGGARGDTRSAPSAHVNEDEEASLGLSKQALQWRKEKDGWPAAMRLRTRETLKDDMDDTPEEEEDVVEPGVP
ncbi:DUF6534 domain-containing protein [Rhodotorula paludigena]|uniref:DUF6534 domain-containing protein n=1 Tax=Rhodotorula paludigena TaxID=86838 RepID=UPI00317554F2